MEIKRNFENSVFNLVELQIVPSTLWFLSSGISDIWITTMEQFSCVNWTDETVFTIFFSVGEQNTIDFSSAGGLRNTFAFLKRVVLGWLQCKYEILLCVCVCVCVSVCVHLCVYMCVCEREREREKEKKREGKERDCELEVWQWHLAVFCLTFLQSNKQGPICQEQQSRMWRYLTR